MRVKVRREVLREILRGQLDDVRDVVAALRRNLTVVEARNSAALTYVRDKQAEIMGKAASDLTPEDVGVSSVLVTMKYLLTHDEETT